MSNALMLAKLLGYNPKNIAGVAEQALPVATGFIAEPVSGLVGAYEAARGGYSGGAVDAVRDAMTYQPKTKSGQMYQKSIMNGMQSIMQSPPVQMWQRGVDTAGEYSPTAGALLKSAPTLLSVATGAKGALQAGRSASSLLNRVESFAPRNMQVAGGIGKQDGVFAGTMAKTADLDALNKAKLLHESGIAPQDIWKETGWLKAPDGKWRFEIDDRFAYLTGKNGSLGDYINHPALFEAYPDLKKIAVRRDLSDAAGNYGEINGIETIGINKKYENEGILLHEIQHAIQKKEGFETGGSPDDSLRWLVKDGKANSVENAYNNLLGEVEARMVQNRRHMLSKHYDAKEYRDPDLYPYQDDLYFGSGGLDVHPKKIILKNK